MRLLCTHLTKDVFLFTPFDTSALWDGVDSCYGLNHKFLLYLCRCQRVKQLEAALCSGG